MAHPPRRFFARVPRKPFLWAIVVLAFALETRAAEPKTEWKLVTRSGDVNIYEKSHPGSPVREFKGEGLIDAPTVVAKRVLEDVPAYPAFMPFVIEARVISVEDRGRVSYQRISPPMVGDRDYTVRVRFESRPHPGGPAYLSRWKIANELGPPEEPGVTRVKVSEGSWLLEPASEGRQTQATYTIYTDSGGGMPSFVLNVAGKTAVPKVFAGVRKQVLLPKYASDAR